MNSLKNRVQLIGRLGADPETKSLDGNKKLAKFSLATNETYKNAKGEKITETQWHNVVAWGKTADMVEKYLNKGKDVAIEGKLINKSYVDKDGNKRYAFEIQLNELLLIGSNK